MEQITDEIKPTQSPTFSTFENLLAVLGRQEGTAAYEFTLKNTLAMYPASFAQWVRELEEVDYASLSDDTQAAARQFALRYQMSDYGWLEYGRFLTGLWCIAENNWEGARRAYEVETFPELPIEVQMQVFEYKDYLDRLISTTSYVR
jgi:hypothetical protein